MTLAIESSKAFPLSVWALTINICAIRSRLLNFLNTESTQAFGSFIPSINDFGVCAIRARGHKNAHKKTICLTFLFM
jgi:hypothetical protein